MNDILKTRRKPKIDIVPLVDVLMVLIIFFLVTMQFQDLRALNVKLPKIETAGSNVMRNELIISIKNTGETFINGNEAKTTLKQRIAELTGDDEENVYLFPSGMTAVYTAYRILQQFRPELKSVQFGFPYVDSLKIQEKFGTGVHFYPHGNEEDFSDLEKQLNDNKVMGLFCEMPSNPLFSSRGTTALL